MAGESGSFWQLERVNRRRTRALVMKLVLVLAAFGLGALFQLVSIVEQAPPTANPRNARDRVRVA